VQSGHANRDWGWKGVEHGEITVESGAVMQAGRISGDFLWAYVEGRLAPRTCATIDRYLARHPEIAQEVQRMRQHQEILDTEDPAVLQEPVPERLSAVIEQARRQDLAEQGSSRDENDPGEAE